MSLYETVNHTEKTKNERVFLVGVLLADKNPGTSGKFAETPLEELTGLAEAAGTQVAGRMVQRKQKPEPATYIGSGKVEELREMVEAADADAVIFDNDLSPAQVRNLEKALKVKVLDRTELILDIFSSRAQTREARLAVELAQLEYSLPRLKRMWTHLSRQKMGVGARGPGEKQLETDRRLAQKRIADLKAELLDVQKRKEREVASRNETRTVSLVGYTNAGKSTLMNAMTGADVFVKDQLFATLDTRTRKWNLPGWGPVLLSDTVGFIRDLPHQLIASFRATLEEARCADLLLHVADGSSPMLFHQIKAAYEVLEELGIQEHDTILVINKVDAFQAGEGCEGARNSPPLEGCPKGGVVGTTMRSAPTPPSAAPPPLQRRGIHHPVSCADTPPEEGNDDSVQISHLPPAQRKQALLNHYPHAIFISALTGEGLDRLAEAVSELLSRNFPVVDVETTAANGKLLAFLAERGEVFSREFLEDGRVIVRCRISQSHLGKISDPAIIVRRVEHVS